MRRFLGSLVGAAILSMPLTVAAHHHLKHDFYVYDTDTAGFVFGAAVTVVYENGSQSGETEAPHGRIQFRLPGEYEFVDVLVEAEGYCRLETNVRLGFRPHVGGKGIYLGVEPCPADAEP